MKQLVENAPAHIRSKMIPRTYGRGEPILLPGMKGSSLRIITEGRALVYRDTPMGAQVQIYINDPYTVVGEVECFLENQETFGVTAITSCKVLELPYGVLLEWMGEDVNVSAYMVGAVCRKMLEETATMARLITMTVDDRVLDALLCTWEAGWLPRLTKEQLCVMTAAPLRSVNRSIGKWRRMGWVDYSHKIFSVVCPQQARTYLEDRLPVNGGKTGSVFGKNLSTNG